MKFRKIHIDGFGKLVNFDLEFSPKFNLILAPNDSGKSTLQHAIYAFLFPFGEPLGEGKKLRLIYYPWSETKYGGFIEFKVNDNIYRIEKTIGDVLRKDKVSIYHLKESGISELNQIPLDKKYGYLTGKFFLGLSREVFESISLIRQLEVFEIGNKDKLLDYIRALIETGRKESNLTQAIRKLESRRKEMGDPQKMGKTTPGGKLMIQFKQLEETLQNWQKDQKEWLSAEKRKRDLDLEFQKMKDILSSLKEKISFHTKLLRKGYEFLEKEINSYPKKISELSPSLIEELTKLERYYLESNPKLKEYEDKRKLFSSHRKKIKLILFFLVPLLFLISIPLYFISIKNAVFTFILSFLMIITGLYYKRKFTKRIEELSGKIKNILEEFKLHFNKLNAIYPLQPLHSSQDLDKNFSLLLKSLQINSINELKIKWEEKQRMESLLEELKDLNINELDLPSEKISINKDRIRINLRDYRRLRIKENQLKERLNKVLAESKYLQGIIDEKTKNLTKARPLSQIEQDYKEIEVKLKKFEIYRDAIATAIRYLQQAGEKIYSQASPFINDFVNSWLPRFSSQYEAVSIDENLNLKLKVKGKQGLVGLDNIGKGMQTAIYLILRIAILKLISNYKKEITPLILDETFNAIDDFGPNRQEKILNLLLEIMEEIGLQIIYFTCQKKGQYLPFKEILGKRYEIKEYCLNDFRILTI